MATWTKQQGDWFARAEQNQDTKEANTAAWYRQAQANNLAKAGTLAPLQNAQFNTAIDAANQNYGQSLAQNAYSRGQAVAAGNAQHQQLLQRYDDMRQQMPYAANARGILGSGIWNQQLQDAARNQATTLGNFQTQQGGVLGQFDLMRQQLAAQRAGTVGGLQTQRTAALQQQNTSVPGFGA